MTDIIHELRYEHEHLQQIIALMNARFNQFRNHITSDCEWLLDATLLIKRYHKAVHQPVEDLFLEKLLTHTGSKAYGLLKPYLHGDRLIFIDHSSAFIDTLNNAINGVVVSRETLITLGETAVKDLNRQIAFEERAIFPLGKQLLSNDDWLEIGQEIENLHDTNLENRLTHECVSLRKRAGQLLH